MFLKKIKIDSLSLIIFIAGAVVMILELIGSRLLAPYLGTSTFVWAALIGLVLGALSLGYYLGGRFSETNPSLSFLALILFLAGLTILLLTLIKEPILSLAASLGVKFGSVAAAFCLFAAPSLLLGMISPYAIRLKIKNIENSGNVAGNLYALSTMGSIFGTFLAGFYLIPTFGSTQILFGLSLILILASLAGDKKPLKLAVLGLVIVFWLLSQAWPKADVFEGDSAYNHIRVVDAQEAGTKRPVRLLYLATETHSIIYQDSMELYSPYQKLYSLDNLFTPQIKNALTLGGGAYIGPQDFLRRYPQAQMTVVEIDPQVTKTAQNYFGLKNDPRLKIVHQDGRIFLNNNQEKYDAVYGDAYASYYSIPFQLTTKEALIKISQALSPDGVLVLNIISALTGEGAKFFLAELKTLKTVFPQVYIFPARYFKDQNLTRPQNIIVFAGKNKIRLTKTELLTKATAAQKTWLDQLWEKEISLDEKIRILTDDFAPVDYYISKLL